MNAKFSPILLSLVVALGAQLVGCDEALSDNDDANATDTGVGSDVSDVATDTNTDADMDVESDTGGEWDPAAYAETILAGAWAADMSLDFDGTETLTIADDGLPDRGALEQYAVPDGTTTGVVETPYSLDIPMRPVLAESPTDTTLGAIGVTLSGGLMFNPYEGGGGVALDDNYTADGIPFIDSCNGHPVGNGAQYHYHGIPYCITDDIDVDGAHSVLLGVLLDGFPLYGPNGADGEGPGDLDACNGHEGATPEFPEGIYHYHLTEVAPYSIDCFAGEVETTTGPGDPPDGMEAIECVDDMATGCCGDDVCDGPETADNCAADCQ